MSSFAQKIWLAVALLLLCIGGIVFQQFFYLGTLSISGVEPPFSVVSRDGEEGKCTTLPCTISFPPGKWDLEITKDGYRPYQGGVEIFFQKETDLFVSLVKTPELSAYAGKLQESPIFSPPNQNTLFRNLTDFSFTGENLFVGDRMITSFPGFFVGISSDEVGRGVWAFSSEKIFFVDTQLAQKQLISNNTTISFLRPLSGGAILAETEEGIILFTSQGEKTILPSSFNGGVKSVCETGANEFLGLFKSNNGTEILFWKKGKPSTTSLSSLQNFSSNDFLYLLCPSPHTGVLVFKNTPPLLFQF